MRQDWKDHKSKIRAPPSASTCQAASRSPLPSLGNRSLSLFHQASVPQRWTRSSQEDIAYGSRRHRLSLSRVQSMAVMCPSARQRLQRLRPHRRRTGYDSSTKKASACAISSTSCRTRSSKSGIAAIESRSRLVRLQGGATGMSARWGDKPAAEGDGMEGDGGWVRPQRHQYGHLRGRQRHALGMAPALRGRTREEQTTRCCGPLEMW